MERNKLGKGGIIAAIAAAVIGVGTATAAHATTAPPQLSVTLSACGTGSSAGWDAAGNPVLTIGHAAAGTCNDPSAGGGYAQLVVNLASTAEPQSAPTFTTDNYAAGSPRWVVELANSYYLFGYPAQLYSPADDMATGNNWQVNGPSATACGGSYVTYAKALSCADPAGAATVKSAFIVSDEDQKAGTASTLTNVQYGGAVVQVRTSGMFVMRNWLSGKCLNVLGNNYTAGYPLDQWTCFAIAEHQAAGNERFVYQTYADGSQYLRAVPPNSTTPGLYVQSTGKGQAMTLTATPTPYTWNTDVFTFPEGGNTVMDDSAYGLANGNKIWGWPFTGASNQRWTLLAA